MAPARSSHRTGSETIRLDKWLWQARFFKSRSLATTAVQAGELRINGVHCLKPAHAVAAGDTLTFIQAGRVRVVRLLATGLRRGPAPEARLLYEDLAPLEPGDAAAIPDGPKRRTEADFPKPPLD